MKITDVLLDTQPIFVSRKTAKAVGLNEAILLQAMHFLNERDVYEWHNGIAFIKKTYQEWSEAFPFWDTETIKQIFINLEWLGLLIPYKPETPLPSDAGEAYRIDYGSWKRILEAE